MSLHIPWDKADPAALKAKAAELGLGFDAMNSNTFSDAPGQALSYKFGSLSHTDAAVRAQAVEHNLECIAIGRAIGSKALTVWIGDGSNFPGQAHFTRAFERYLDAMRTIYGALPEDWRLFSEHKMYEPAFYSTVVQDWGTNYLIAQELGPKAFCLVDLGHHAPNVNIEMIVARLIQFGKLGGFHFNDSKYGDDDLDAGSIDPYRLFLVFNELVDAEDRGAPGFQPAHMLDQSHNVTDPIESLMVSAMEVQPRLRPGAARRPRGARGLPGGERRADGDPDAQGRLPHRRRADPGAGAAGEGRRHRPGRRLPRQPLPRHGGRAAAGGGEHGRRDRLMHEVERRPASGPAAALEPLPLHPFLIDGANLGAGGEGRAPALGVGPEHQHPSLAVAVAVDHPCPLRQRRVDRLDPGGEAGADRADPLRALDRGHGPAGLDRPADPLRGEDQHLAGERHAHRGDAGADQPVGQGRVPDVMRHVVEAVLGKGAAADIAISRSAPGSRRP